MGNVESDPRSMGGDRGVSYTDDTGVMFQIDHQRSTLFTRVHNIVPTAPPAGLQKIQSPSILRAGDRVVHLSGAQVVIDGIDSNVSDADVIAHNYRKPDNQRVSQLVGPLIHWRPVVDDGLFSKAAKLLTGRSGDDSKAAARQPLHCDLTRDAAQRFFLPEKKVKELTVRAAGHPRKQFQSEGVMLTDVVIRRKEMATPMLMWCSCCIVQWFLYHRPREGLKVDEKLVKELLAASNQSAAAAAEAAAAKQAEAATLKEIAELEAQIAAVSAAGGSAKGSKSKPKAKHSELDALDLLKEAEALVNASSVSGSGSGAGGGERKATKEELEVEALLGALEGVPAESAAPKKKVPKKSQAELDIEAEIAKAKADIEKKMQNEQRGKSSRDAAKEKAKLAAQAKKDKERAAAGAATGATPKPVPPTGTTGAAAVAAAGQFAKNADAMIKNFHTGTGAASGPGSGAGGVGGPSRPFPSAFEFVNPHSPQPPGGISSAALHASLNATLAGSAAFHSATGMAAPTPGVVLPTPSAPLASAVGAPSGGDLSNLQAFHAKASGAKDVPNTKQPESPTTKTTAATATAAAAGAPPAFPPSETTAVYPYVYDKHMHVPSLSKFLADCANRKEALNVTWNQAFYDGKRQFCNRSVTICTPQLKMITAGKGCLFPYVPSTTLVQVLHVNPEQGDPDNRNGGYRLYVEPSGSAGQHSPERAHVWRMMRVAPYFAKFEKTLKSNLRLTISHHKDKTDLNSAESYRWAKAWYDALEYVLLVRYDMFERFEFRQTGESTASSVTIPGYAVEARSLTFEPVNPMAHLSAAQLDVLAALQCYVFRRSTEKGVPMVLGEFRYQFVNNKVVWVYDVDLHSNVEDFGMPPGKGSLEYGHKVFEGHRCNALCKLSTKGRGDNAR